MSLVDGFIARLRDLFARSAWERRIDQELRFHIDMETERWVREGVHPADARRRALARFGGVEYQRERLRDGRAIGVAHIGRDIRFAVRSLLRRPGFLISAALSLGLGLTVVGTVAAVLNAYASSSLPYSAADRLYYVMYAPPGPVQRAGWRR